MRGNREGEAYIHSAAVMLNRRVYEFFDFGKSHNLVKFLTNFALHHAENGAIEVNVLSASQFRMETSADLQQARDPTAQQNPAFRRLSNTAEDLEQRTFAGSISPNDADDLALLHLEAHILECPELLHSVALNNLPPAGE